MAASPQLGITVVVFCGNSLNRIELALSRRIPQSLHAQHQQRWAPLANGPLPPDLAGQQAVLIGQVGPSD